MEKTSRIFIAGHRGLVGSAIRRGLEQQGYTNLLLRSRAELDLTDKAAVLAFFEQEQPEYVFLAAAKVGGIVANDTYPADFIRENLEIQTNVIDAAYRSGVKRLLFLGSSCIYPKLCPQPIKEEYLLTGPLEPTNRAYALAKIAGIEMCWSYNRQYGTQFLAAMPTNLYGPNDNFDLKNSHVLPALIRKAAEAKAAGAKSITVWGTGTPRRELLYSDDLAEACLYLISLPEAEFAKLLTADEPPLINIGTGEDLTIRELAELVCRVVGFEGELLFDTTRPDGTPRKLMDVSRIKALGWQATTPLEEGIRRVYENVKEMFLTSV
ncbi:GDP-L-fucose synthase family protein [Silvibacterium sp.]|uniref:GDP-L-fucose synthase family protein n=1 Tax=Silvibacterium sp. TaxID=1964179 RepID=UPI0039E63970